MGKGEIARYEQFFLFPQCFQEASFPWAPKGVIVREWVSHTISPLTLKKKPFENIMGKDENAGNQHFLLFPLCFSALPKTNFNFSVTFLLSSTNAFKFDQSKNTSFGKELNVF